MGTICTMVCKNGTPCKCKAKPGFDVCGRHQKNECPVCYSFPNKSNMTTLECKHSFCTDCITKWLKENDTCPVCRHQIELPKPSDVPPVEIHGGSDTSVKEYLQLVQYAYTSGRVDLLARLSGMGPEWLRKYTESLY